MDLSKRLVFNKRRPTIEQIYKDLYDVYGITNVVENTDRRWWLAEALWHDLDAKFANYKAYIEPGMNARHLFELRKSMVLRDLPGSEEFRKRSCRCRTVQEVIQCRVDFLAQYFAEYIDLPWQYYVVIWFMWKKPRIDNFVFDFESCFVDGDASKQTMVNQYLEDMIYTQVHGGGRR